MSEEEEIIQPKGRVAPDDLGTSILLSAGYDGALQKAYVRLYEPESQVIYLWYDDTGHLPYLISKQTVEELQGNRRVVGHEGFKSLNPVIKFDALAGEDIMVTKVVAKDPLSVGGAPGCIRGYLDESWESRIRYYGCYMYDEHLVPGMPYRVEKGKLVQGDWNLPESVEAEFNEILSRTEEHLKEPMREWARLLQSPVPNIRRVAVDIEVRPSMKNRVPSPDEAKDPITAVAFAGSDGLRRIMLLNDSGLPVETPQIAGANEVAVHESEREIIQETFRLLDQYPVVLTFNGDDFDFKYLRNRARNLGVPDDENPITLGRRFAFLTNGVHIDLYQFFRNRSIQGYAFGNVYREHTLDEIASSILHEGKIAVQDIAQLGIKELGDYCMQDAYITYYLTAFNDDLVMDLMVLLSRISKSILEDVSRMGVSRWILSLMEWEHRRLGWLIPNAQDIIEAKGGTTTEAIIKGKKYQGAIVRDPVPGIHFDVTVLDFASLYPSAIRNWNLSYDTLLCTHEECKGNLVPGTPHWVCTKRKGMTTNLIGSLKDIRVLWYKPRSRDKGLTEGERQYYNVVQQALKVFLNASYGVFGAESFPLYCPPLAESTAAVGRYALEEATKKSVELGIEVLYGDTDSLFLNHPSKQQTDALTAWALGELVIDLEVDKVYRYAVFSKLKKNYLGVYKDGRLDIKGLTGKKRHIPPLLANAFDEITKVLSEVERPEEFPLAKNNIRNIVNTVYNKLKDGNYDIEEVAFSMMLSKSPSQYNTNPQHIKAARMLVERGYELESGDLISYILKKPPSEKYQAKVKKSIKDQSKTLGKKGQALPFGVMPLQIAKKSDVYFAKYIEHLESMVGQLLDVLEIDFDAMIGRPQQTSLGAFFGAPPRR